VDNNETLNELTLLRTDIEAIESNVQRLEEALRAWEANQRWQLNDIRKDLKNIGWMANLCAFAAAVYVISEALRRWG